jgi:hypothetical protein
MEQAKSRQWLPLLPKNNIIPQKREDRAILLQCMGIALVFWIGVRMSQTYVSTKSIELHFNMPPGRALRKAAPANLSIQIRGRGWDILYDFLLGGKIHLYYDLQQRNSIQLDRQRLLRDIKAALHADDLALSNLSHSNLRLSLEPKQEKWLPIKLVTDLHYKTGYYLSGNVKLDPDKVLVSGPQSLISNTYEWPTLPLRLKNLQSNYEGVLNLKMPLAEMQLNAHKVKVKVPVEQVTEKTLYVKIAAKNADREYRLFPSQVRLTCNVGLSHFNTLFSNDFEAEVDLSKAAFQEGNTVPVTVKLQPTIVTNVRFVPKVVEFYVVKKEGK